MLDVGQLMLAVDAHNRRKEEAVVAVTPPPPAANYEGPKPAPSQRPDNLANAAEYADL